MSESGSELSDRGLFLPNGKPILSTPSPDQIVKINSEPRAEYFSTLGSKPEVVASWLKFGGIDKIPGVVGQFNKTAYEYHQKHVLGPLLERVSSEFGIAPTNVVLRGSAGSIDEPVDAKTYGKILTLDQMLKAGSDTGKNRTRVASFEDPINPKSVTEDAVTLYGRGHADAYLQSWSAMLRNDLINEENAKSIFPILFIYDASKLKRDNHDQVLPDDPREREKVIIKAYVLDHLHEENAKKN